MLYHLQYLSEWFAGFGLLRHAEARAALAALTAFALALVFGRWFVRFQTRHRALETIEKGDSKRLDLMQAMKKGTPTMGGVIFLVALCASALLWSRPGHRLVLLLLAFTVALGGLGFADDWIKLRYPERKGLRPRTKLLVQLGLGAIAGWYLWAYPLDARLGSDAEGVGTALFIPFVDGYCVPLGIGTVVLVSLVTTATSNAVNLTDGLDGLAIGCSVLVGAAFVGLALLAGHESSSELFRIPHVPEVREVAVFGAAFVGAGIGFLWFNCHPAQIFMGDTGALALGGLLALTAVMCKQEILLLLAGGVLVAETVSVILQVASFRLRGKRIFLCAPFHHHLQFRGWAETRITVCFWVASAAFALSSLVTLTLR